MVSPTEGAINEMASGLGRRGCRMERREGTIDIIYEVGNVATKLEGDDKGDLMSGRGNKSFMLVIV
jgi:hypothetical protein